MACQALGPLCAEAEVRARSFLFPQDTPEERYHRALWELELARANFDEALAAYAREYADGEALTAKAIEREGDD